MAISFKELCNYIRDQIDAKQPNTTTLVKRMLGLPDTELNNIEKSTFINKISGIQKLCRISYATIGGLLVETIIQYIKIKYPTSPSNQLRILTKYIERLKNQKFTPADTIRILKKLKLENSEFYKTVTNKENFKTISENAKKLLHEVDISKFNKTYNNEYIKKAIEKVEKETEVTNTSLEANDLEELLQILANIKATCKDETIGDASTFIGELQLLLPESPIENLKEEIKYLQIVIDDRRKEPELTKQLNSCHPELKRKLVAAKTKIEKRIDALNAPSQTDLIKSPKGDDKQMIMDLNAIKAAQRKNLDLAQKINTAYHEACKKYKPDNIDDIVTSILGNLKGTINSGETLTYYAGIQKSDIEDFPYLKIIDCEKREQKSEDTIKNYTKYMQGNTEAIAERDSIIMCVMSKNIKEPVVFTEKSWGYDIKYKKYIESILFSKQELFPCTIIPVSNSNSINDSYDPEALKNAEKKIYALADDLNSIFISSESVTAETLQDEYNKHTKQRKLRFCEGCTEKYQKFKTTKIYETTAEKVLENYLKWGNKATPDQKLMIAKFIISSIVPRVAFVDDSKTNNFINDVVFRLYNPLTDEQRKKYGNDFRALILLAEKVDKSLTYIKTKIDINKSLAQNHLANNSSTEARKSKANEALKKLGLFYKQYSEYSNKVKNFLASAQSSEGSKQILEYLDDCKKYLGTIDKWITEKDKEMGTLISLIAFAQQTGYTAWKQGTKPTIGSYRVAGQQPAASAQAQPQQMPQQQTYPPVNPTMQQQARSPIYQNYAQQPLPTQSQIAQQPPGDQPRPQQTQNQQQPPYPMPQGQPQPYVQQPYPSQQIAQQPPGGQPQYVQSSEQPQPYFQQIYTQQTTKPQYPQNPYYPQAQQLYTNSNQMAYKQHPQQQQPQAQPNQSPSKLTDEELTKQNLMKNLESLSQRINTTWTEITKLGNQIDQLLTTPNLNSDQKKYSFDSKGFLMQKRNELDTTYKAAKGCYDKLKSVKNYSTTNPESITTPLGTIAQANDWVNKSLEGIQKFNATLEGISKTLSTIQQNQGQAEEVKTEEAEKKPPTEPLPTPPAEPLPTPPAEPLPTPPAKPLPTPPAEPLPTPPAKPLPTPPAKKAAEEAQGEQKPLANENSSAQTEQQNQDQAEEVKTEEAKPEEAKAEEDKRKEDNGEERENSKENP